MSYTKLGVGLLLAAVLLAGTTSGAGAGDTPPGVLYGKPAADPQSWRWDWDIYPEDLALIVVPDSGTAVVLPTHVQDNLIRQEVDFANQVAFVAAMTPIAAQDGLRIDEIALREDGLVVAISLQGGTPGDVHGSTAGDSHGAQGEPREAIVHSIARVEAARLPAGTLPVTLVDQYGYVVDRLVLEVQPADAGAGEGPRVVAQPRSLPPGGPDGEDPEEAAHEWQIPLAGEYEPGVHATEADRYLGRDLIPHTVAAGETLWTIAQGYGVALERLLEVNFDMDPHHLQPGVQVWVDVPGNAAP